VSSPGLDRPLRKPADFQRFAGLEIEVTLKRPFQGRKKYRGLLQATADVAEAQPLAFELVFRDGQEDKVFGFALEEIREARLVPVVDFKKGRKRREVVDGAGAADVAAQLPAGEAKDSGGHEE
jgi:ribosome maturation factor RimP